MRNYLLMKKKQIMKTFIEIIYNYTIKITNYKVGVI